MIGVPEPTSSTWSLTPSGVEIFAIAVLSQTSRQRDRTSFAYKQKASQLTTGPQAAKNGHAPTGMAAIGPVAQAPMRAFAALPTASTLSPASRKATMRQGQPSRPSYRQGNAPISARLL